MIDVASILARIPDDVKRTHHGRSPEEGFDCVGLPMFVMSEAGRSLDWLDLRYSEDQAETTNAAIVHQLRFACQTNPPLLNEVTAKVAAGMDVDGDIWIMSAGRKDLVHAGIQCDGTVWHMEAKLHKRPANKLRPYLVAAFRI